MKGFYLLLMPFLMVAVFASCAGGGNGHTETAPMPTDAPPLGTAPEPDEPPDEQPVETVPGEYEAENMFEGPNWSMEIAVGWALLDVFGTHMLFAPHEGGSHITVQLESMRGQSLDEIAAEVLQVYELMLEDFELMSVDYMAINGNDAVMISFMAPSAGVYAMYQFVIENEGIGYIVTYMMMDEDDFYGDVMDMLATFSVQEPGIENAQIVGEWRMTSSSDPSTEWGLQNGWEYVLHFFYDGSSIEFWHIPDSGMHEVEKSAWAVSGALLIMTPVETNIDVFSHYFGEEYAAIIGEALGLPFVQEFHVEDDILTLILGRYQNIYQRY